MAFFPKEQPSVQKTQEVMRSDNQTQSAEGIIKELVRYFFLFVVLLCCFYFIFHFCNLSISVIISILTGTHSYFCFSRDAIVA